MTIAELKQLKESEDKVEFKEAKNQYAYNSSRKSVLGYTVAFANEKGGYLVFGLEDAHPHRVCGSKAYEGREGQLEQDVYRDTGVRIQTEVLYEGINRVLVIKIPSRPVGKPLYFNDVPLMRVGDGLDRMSEELKKSGLIEKVSEHTHRYTLSNEYHTLVNDGLENEHKNTTGQIGGQMPSNRIKILNYIIENNYITRKELTIKVGIITLTIRRSWCRK